MKKIFLFILIVSLNSSCNNTRQDTILKSYLIPPDKMADFLADAHIAEAELMINRIFGDSNIQASVDYYSYLIKKHEFDKNDFVKSINYYMGRPDELELIYEKVNEILSTQEGEKW